MSTTSRSFPSEVAGSTTGRLYTCLKSTSTWSGSATRDPADKIKSTRTSVTWDAVDSAKGFGSVHKRKPLLVELQ